MPSRIPTHRSGGEAAASAAAAGDYRRRADRLEDNRFYARKAWIDLRNLVRAEEPLCRLCLADGRVTATAAIDHIIPRKERPDLALDRANLRGLCGPHHNSVRRDQGIR